MLSSYIKLDKWLLRFLYRERDEPSLKIKSEKREYLYLHSLLKPLVTSRLVGFSRYITVNCTLLALNIAQASNFNIRLISQYLLEQ